MSLILALFILTPQQCIVRYVRTVYAFQTTESHVASIPQIDPALIFAVIMVESGCNRTMIGGAGEIGLMQVLPYWHSGDLRDVPTNIHRGANLLACTLTDQEHNPTGSPFLALAAYNCGWDKLARDACGNGGYRYAGTVYDELPGVREALSWYAMREWTEPAVRFWLNEWGYGVGELSRYELQEQPAPPA